jgi:SAM-dependent MidA family methyltransferase
LIVDRIRAGGPLTFAAYMELALYHPEHGYYTSAAQRSGRAGDFFTSVDLGPVFGEMLASQFGEMWRHLSEHTTGGVHAAADLELVECGAGNGRLTRDVLDAAARLDPEFYRALKVRLVERSAPARAAHAPALGPHAAKLAGSGPGLREGFSGILFANELLDALPAHRVRGTEDGIEELYVALDGSRLVERPGPASTPALARYFERLGIALPVGLVAEVPLAAEAWLRSAASRLRWGFIVLVDYGHEARELYSPTHGTGTLAAYQDHVASDAERWLDEPGEHDLTLHVDFTTMCRTAVDAGLDVLGLLDQTYFLLGLGIAGRLEAAHGEGVAGLRRRLALKTLLLPGGLGSTHKVLILGRGVGSPSLAGCSYRARLT